MSPFFYPIPLLSRCVFDSVCQIFAKLGKMLKYFYWQTGYAAIGIGQYHINNLKRYKSNQKEDHRERTFMEEYIELLNKYSIQYDECYMWN